MMARGMGSRSEQNTISLITSERPRGRSLFFDFPVLGIVMDGDQRVIIRNLVIDTDLRLASLRGSGGRGRYQHPDPGRIPVTASTPVGFMTFKT